MVGIHLEDIEGLRRNCSIAGTISVNYAKKPFWQFRYPASILDTPATDAVGMVTSPARGEEVGISW